MKKYRWLTLLITTIFLFTTFHSVPASAANERALQDESIYDLLVDRFYDGNRSNDENVDVRNPNAFSGGDFAGIIEKVAYLKDMGFTQVSIGPVFKTATYDGNEVIDYEEFEPHFGTEEEFEMMLETLRDQGIGTIVDIPMNGVSKNHVWIKDGKLSSITNEDGTANWVTTDEQVTETLKRTILSFVETYDIAGIRLTNLKDYDQSFLNEIIEETKKVREGLYVLTNEATDANFDLALNDEKMDALKEAYVQVNPDSSKLELFNDQVETDLIQLDALNGPRLTFGMTELRMFPPTRWKIASVALFTLPGVPLLTYESEIAVTGKEAPESHPIVNFKADSELYDYIADLNKLRNESETLRTGDFEMLHNENGFTVFTRKSEEETWIIAINNTSETANIEIDEEVIGENKKLRGLLDNDKIRQSKDGKYRIVLERELAEVYIADEDKGFNTPYLIATILIYASFFAFLFVVFRRGKKNKKA